jgi:hypothetical protein
MTKVFNPFVWAGTALILKFKPKDYFLFLLKEAVKYKYGLSNRLLAILMNKGSRTIDKWGVQTVASMKDFTFLKKMHMMIRLLSVA